MDRFPETMNGIPAYPVSCMRTQHNLNRRSVNNVQQSIQKKRVARNEDRNRSLSFTPVTHFESHSNLASERLVHYQSEALIQPDNFRVCNNYRKKVEGNRILRSERHI